MIRLACVLFTFTLLTHSFLPATRAYIADPIHEHCLKSTPNFISNASVDSVRRVQQALVCGRNLNDRNNEFQAWRELGLVHILVVSGGHLSILVFFVQGIAQSLLLITAPRVPISWKRGFLHVLILSFMTWLVAANHFAPPVLRAWIDFLIRKPLRQIGYQGQESSFISTWLTLPTISGQSDLLSLSLSFFASVLIEFVGNRLHRRPWLAAFTLQAALWWILLPLLLPLGLPHPLATLSNLLVAPLLGGLLIPLALAHFCLYQFGINWLGSPFYWTWKLFHKAVLFLAEFSPDLAPRIQVTDFGRLIVGTSLLLLTGGLVLRQSAQGRRSLASISVWKPLLFSATLMIAGTYLHISLSNYRTEQNKKGSLKLKTPCPKKTVSELRSVIRRDRVCIPYPTIEPQARSKHCRRKRLVP
jgi:hypothetical protein